MTEPFTAQGCLDEAALRAIAAGRSHEGTGHLDACVRCEEALSSLVLENELAALTMRRELADATIGAVIGTHYQVLRQCGAGGQSDVFEAVDIRTEQRVALKRFKARISDGRSDAVREWQAATRAKHPHIANVIALIEEPDGEWLAMDFIDGRALSDVLRDGQLSMQEVSRYCAQIISAIDAIHRAGILHRDLKPSNVMVARDRSSIFLIDLGLARDVAPSAHSTKSALVGTPVYWAPELTSGERASVASDLYAFGRIAFEMLANVPEQAQDARVRGIIERCLQPYAQNRYASAQEVHRALDAPSAKRRAWVGASVIVLLLIACAVAWSLRAKPAEQPSVALPQTRNANASPTTDPHALPTAPTAPTAPSTPPSELREPVKAQPRVHAGKKRTAAIDAPPSSPPPSAPPPERPAERREFWFME